MRLLLDTHTVLWFMGEPEILSPKIRDMIKTTGQQAFVSIATLWEIAIKVSLNKLILPGEYEELFPSSVWASGLSILPIEPHHLALVRRLEFYHRDPFDRLLIAQAKTENMILVSKDSQFSAYDIQILW